MIEFWTNEVLVGFDLEDCEGGEGEGLAPAVVRYQCLPAPQKGQDGREGLPLPIEGLA